MKKIQLLLCILFINLIFLVNAQKWHYNFQESVDKAKKENKNILLIFQGSDWCVPCIKLERKVWQSDIFISYAEKKLILQKVDYPKRKKNKLSAEQEKKNNELAKKFNENGYFPHIVLLDSNGKFIKNLKTNELNPKKYISLLQGVK